MAPDDHPFPFRCARSGEPGLDDVDHVLRRVLNPSGLEWPTGSEPNPFVRYRSLFHAYHVATAKARSDAE